MNRENEFDELARRKLEERSFTYQESDWKQAQQAIAAQRGRKRRGFWLLGAAALLMVGTTAWWSLREAERDGTLANTAPVTNRRTAAAEQHAANEAQDPSTSSASTTSTASAVPTTDDIASASVDTDQIPATPYSAGVASNAPAQALASSTAAAHTSSTSSNTPYRDRNTSPQRNSTAVASTGMTTTGAPKAGTSAETPNTSVPNTVDRGTIIPATVSGTAMPSPATASSEQGNAEPPPPAMAVDPTAEVSPGTTKNTDTLDEPELIMPLTTAPTTSPSDSATTAPTAVPAVPPIIPDRAPWEISVLGGGLSSIATYSGGNSAEWSGDISREVSPGFGAELMHLGRNIGLGMGLHYGTYAERIQVPAIDRTSIERRNYWYLMPVDTTILLITDTVQQGGQTVYEGASITTTVNVLTLGEDSTLTTTHVRDAGEPVNRTSYLEVPLLFDAHLVQGRWSMGLRGGPTVGLLTGRTGGIPNSTKDGHTEPGDQAFREVVFGWTARAYLRYRWNAAWSIGIEPAMRGLFVNSLSEGDVKRRSSAFGGMISLSYRLR
jgi:hypothetical protein